MSAIRRILPLLFLCVRASAAGVEPSTLTLTSDARVELLGVVQYLAGYHQAVRGEDLSGVEKRFGRFRSHPVVKTYAETPSRLKGGEPYGLISLLLTDPPELAWSREPSLLSGEFISEAGGMPKLEEFLAQLRDFARTSDFAGYYSDQAPERALVEKSARAELDGRDYVGALEAYEGRGLNSRVRFILCRLYSPRTLVSYIVPYPFQGPRMPPRPGPYDVYALLAPRKLKRGAVSYGLSEPMNDFSELVYVMVEPGMALSAGAIEKARGLHRAVAADCFADWNTCAGDLIVRAVSARIEKAVLGREPRPRHGKIGEYDRALNARLIEYESQRARYPTFDDFFPRLADVFGELSASSSPARSGP
jgi:hypothetical protein